MRKWVQGSSHQIALKGPMVFVSRWRHTVGRSRRHSWIGLSGGTMGLVSV